MLRTRWAAFCVMACTDLGRRSLRGAPTDALPNGLLRAEADLSDLGNSGQAR